MYVIKQFGFFYLDKKFYAKNIPIQMITLKKHSRNCLPHKAEEEKERCDLW